jgi:DcmR-like sensory protein
MSTKTSHNFCVVEDYDGSRPIFILETIQRAVSEGCAIILVPESNPDDMLELLERRGLSEVKNYVQRGILTILDKDFAYSIAGTDLDAERRLERWFSLISDVVSRSVCQCILVIGTPKFFFDSNNSETLKVYERHIGKRCNENISLQAVCCFDAKSFSTLTLKDIIQILDYHEYVVYKGGVYVRGQPQMIFALVKKAIDNTLGRGSFNLLLKTFKLIYHYDPDNDYDLIISRPELLESLLRRMLGASANKVLARVQKEITSELSYLRRSRDDKNNTAEMRSW